MIGLLFRAGLTAFGAAGLATKAIIVVSAFGMVAGAYGVWHHRVYSAGYDRAIADIARADQRAVARAKGAREALQRCRDRGGRWDQSSGTCT